MARNKVHRAADWSTSSIEFTLVAMDDVEIDTFEADAAQLEADEAAS